MSGHFQAGNTTVSMAEMNLAPLRTVQIIHDWEGWEWASRLWQEWHRRLDFLKRNERGYLVNNNEVMRRSNEVRRWLDERRPRAASALARAGEGER